MSASLNVSPGFDAARSPGDDVDEQQQITDAVTAISERRAVIEQAKGMLMLAFGIDADAAFDVLRQQSQHHNVKLRAFAEQLTKDLPAMTTVMPPDRLLTIIKALQGVHERIAVTAETDAG